ncbi:hypothetical protein COCON_G00085270, partial [Conger conger]
CSARLKQIPADTAARKTWSSGAGLCHVTGCTGATLQVRLYRGDSTGETLQVRLYGGDSTGSHPEARGDKMEDQETRWRIRKQDGGSGNKMEDQETRWRIRKQDGGCTTTKLQCIWQIRFFPSRVLMIFMVMFSEGSVG